MNLGIARWLAWPTRRGWSLIVAAAAAFVVAMVNPSVVSALFCACLWALVTSSLLMSLFCTRGITLKRAPCTDGVMGKPLNLPVQVENTSRFPQQAALVAEALPFALDKVTHTVVEPLTGRERRTVRRQVYAARRGEYDLEPIRLRGGDPAGLFYRERVFRHPETLMIYPERVPIAYIPLRLKARVVAAPMGSAIGASGAGQEFFGIREYRPTDGQRAIHWKASARQNKLMVRQFEENNINQVSLFLDANEAYVSPTDDNNFEYLVRVCASITEYLGGLYVKLLFRATEDTPAHYVYDTSQTAQREIMHRLATIQPGPGGMTNLLLASLDLIPPNSIVFVLTLYEPPGLEGVFEHLLNRGVDVRWIHAPQALFLPPMSPKRQQAVADFARERSQLLPPLVVHPQTRIQQVLAYG